MIKAAQGLLFCLLLTVSAPCHADQNCFLVVAGRDATADGSVIMGHNEDNGIVGVDAWPRLIPLTAT